MALALPLAGLRVLDLTRHLPGPYATLLLAELGAQVDKLEEPSGDPTRTLPDGAPEAGSYFSGLNTGKRSLVLNLKAPGAAAAFLRLAGHYDVLVEGFRPGVLERLGVGHGVLRAAHPRLVLCALSGFGQTGPDRHRAGHDLGYQARAGVLGYQQGPGAPGGQLADVGGALFAVVGILAALLARGQSGEGRLVDVALADAATAFLHMHLSAHLAGGLPLRPGRDVLNGGLPCYRLYRTADGRQLAVAALEPRFFTALCERLGRPELAGPAYAGGAEAEAVHRSLEALFASESLSTWETRLAGLDACVEAVRTPQEVPHDAQFLARGLFVQTPTGVRMATPLRLGPLPEGRPPALGAHSRQVLAEAGFTRAEMDALGVE
ncbi:MAG: CaiB/BaiF CoA transferase family protein [Myxococcaceae bacterium]